MAAIRAFIRDGTYWDGSGTFDAHAPGGVPTGNHGEISGLTIPWASLTAEGFGAGDDVLLIVSGAANSNFTGEWQSITSFMATSYGAGNKFTDFIYYYTSGTGAREGHPFRFMRRRTLSANENIYLGWMGGAAYEGRIKNYTVILLSLDDIGTDHFRWAETFYDDAQMAGSYGASGGPQITIPAWPAGIIGRADCNVGQVQWPVCHARLECSSSGNVGEIVTGWNSSNAGVHAYAMDRYINSPGETIKLAQYNSGTTGAKLWYSQLFAVNLARFQNRSAVQVSPGTNLTNGNDTWPSRTSAPDLQFSAPGPGLGFVYGIIDCRGENTKEPALSYALDGTDSDGGGTGNNFHTTLFPQGNNSNSLFPANKQFSLTIGDTAAKTFEVLASETEDTSPAPILEDVSAFAFSLEIAGAPVPEPNVSTVNSGNPVTPGQTNVAVTGTDLDQGANPTYGGVAVTVSSVTPTSLTIDAIPTSLKYTTGGDGIANSAYEFTFDTGTGAGAHLTPPAGRIAAQNSGGTSRDNGVWEPNKAGSSQNPPADGDQVEMLTDVDSTTADTPTVTTLNGDGFMEVSGVTGPSTISKASAVRFYQSGSWTAWEDWDGVVTDPAPTPPSFDGPDISNQTYQVNEVSAPQDYSGLFSQGSGSFIGYGDENYPPGMSVDALLGVQSGTPTQVGVYPSCRVSLQTDAGTAFSNVFQIEITAAPVPPTFTGNIADQTYDKGQAVNLDVSGEFDPGTGTLTPGYSLNGAPVGLSIGAQSGVITGSVGTAGSVAGVTVSLQTTDGGPVSSNGFTWNTTETEFPPVFGGPIPDQTPYQGTPYSFNISGYWTQQDTAPPVTYSEQTGQLPEGLSLDGATGQITGTALNLGEVDVVTFRCTNAQGFDDSNAVTFTVSEQADVTPDDRWSGWVRTDDVTWEATNLDTGAVAKIVRKSVVTTLPSGKSAYWEGYIDNVLQSPTQDWPHQSWFGMQCYLKQTGWYP